MPQMVPHGTLDYEEMADWGYTPQELVVFSSNINPYGPPPSMVRIVAESITADNLSLYPDRLSHGMRQALADYHDVPPDAVLVGNGTADIMWLLAVLFLRGRSVAILSPTFGEYANAANLVDIEPAVVDYPGWRRQPDSTFIPDDTSLIDASHILVRSSPDVVYVCNPNSPTGEHLSPDEMDALLSSIPNAIWVIDEAYAAFTPEPWSAARWIHDRRIIVLRSMTKDFALGGLRLGYAIARPDTIRTMAEAQPPWNVNSLAQLAGVACMQELAWRDESLATLRRDTELLRRALMELGFSPRTTTTNYMLVPVKDPTALRIELLRRKIVVRDCTSFGLPGFIRLATQRPEHNQILIEALSELTQYGVSTS